MTEISGLVGVLVMDDEPKPLVLAFSTPKVPPNPVCCLFSVPSSEIPNGGELVLTTTPEALVLAPVVGGGSVAFDALGKGGNESNNVTPKEEEGLNGFKPAKPVICGFSVPVLLAPFPTLAGNDDVAAMALLELTFAG